MFCIGRHKIIFLNGSVSMRHTWYQLSLYIEVIIHSHFSNPTSFARVLADISNTITENILDYASLLRNQKKDVPAIKGEHTLLY